LHIILYSYFNTICIGHVNPNYLSLDDNGDEVKNTANS